MRTPTGRVVQERQGTGTKGRRSLSWGNYASAIDFAECEDFTSIAASSAGTGTLEGVGHDQAQGPGAYVDRRRGDARVSEYVCPGCGKLVDPWVPVCVGPHPWFRDRDPVRVAARVTIIRPTFERYECLVCERRFRRAIGDSTVTCQERCERILQRVIATKI